MLKAAKTIDGVGVIWLKACSCCSVLTYYAASFHLLYMGDFILLSRCSVQIIDECSDDNPHMQHVE